MSNILNISISLIIPIFAFFCMYYILINKVFPGHNNMVLTVIMLLAGLCLFLFSDNAILFALNPLGNFLSDAFNLKREMIYALMMAVSCFVGGVLNCLYVILFASVRRGKSFSKTFRNVRNSVNYQLIIILLVAILPTVVFQIMYLERFLPQIFNATWGGPNPTFAGMKTEILTHLFLFETIYAMYLTIEAV